MSSRVPFRFLWNGGEAPGREGCEVRRARLPSPVGPWAVPGGSGHGSPVRSRPLREHHLRTLSSSGRRKSGPQLERRQRTVTDHDPADTRCGRHRVIPRRSTRRPSTGAGPRDRLARNAARRATARRSSVQAQRAGHPAAGAAEMVGRAGKSASSQIQRITASGLTGQGAQAPFSAPRRRPPWGGAGPPMSRDASRSGRRPRVVFPEESRESLKNPFASATGSVTHRAPFGTADTKTQRPSTLLCPSTAVYAPLPPPAASAMS